MRQIAAMLVISFVLAVGLIPGAALAAQSAEVDLLTATAPRLDKASAASGNVSFKKTVVGIDNAAAISQEGYLYVWGDNSCKQLANGTTKPSLKPIRVMGGIVDVKLASKEVFALACDGALWWFGGYDCETPKVLMSGVKQFDVDCYGSHLIVLKTDGSL